MSGCILIALLSLLMMSTVKPVDRGLAISSSNYIDPWLSSVMYVRLENRTAVASVQTEFI